MTTPNHQSNIKEDAEEGLETITNTGNWRKKSRNTGRVDEEKRKKYLNHGCEVVAKTGEQATIKRTANIKGK